MVVPTKTLSVPKLEIVSYSIDFLLTVFKLYCACHSRKIQKQGGGGGGGGSEQRSPKDMQIPGVGILKK